MKGRDFSRSSKLLIVIFTIAGALVFLMMGLTYKHLQRLSEDTGWVYHSQEVTLDLERLCANMKDIEIDRRNYIINHDFDSAKSDVNRAMSENKIILNSLRDLVKDNPQQVENLKSLEQIVNRKYAIVNKTFGGAAMNDQNMQEMKNSLLEGKIIMHAISQKIDEMQGVENRLLKQRRDRFLYSEKFTPVYLYIISVLSLAILAFAFFQTYGELKQQHSINSKLRLQNDISNIAERIGKYGTWTYNPESEEIHFSDNEKRILGYENQHSENGFQLIEKNIHPDDAFPLRRNLRKIIDGETVSPFVSRYMEKDGSGLKYLLSTSEKITMPAGEKILLGVTMDVTEEMLNKKKLEDQNRALDASNQELQAFNYVASHDLQEPLRKIETFISRLFDKDFDRLSDSGKQYLQKTSDSAGRMRKLIEDLLQFSRTNKGENNFEITDLNLILDEVKEEFQPILENTGGRIISEILPEVLSVPFQMKQLFINLIGNSLKYAKENTPVLVEVFSERISAENDFEIADLAKGDYFKITVSDNGIGFDEEYSAKIFQLFSRLHGKKEYEGTGIGLAICKKIVENHRGFIFAHGKPGIGAQFVIYLPVNQLV